MLKGVLITLCLAMLGAPVVAAIEDDEGTRTEWTDIAKAGTFVLVCSLAAPKGVVGANTYQLFIPIGMKDDGLTADQAQRLTDTAAYLFCMPGSKNTTIGMDIQPVGGSDALTAVKGVVCEFMTDLRLPEDIDASATTRTGTLIGTASNANGPVPRITLASVDNAKTVRADGWTVPYAMQGDRVFYLSDSSLSSKVSRQVTINPNGGAGVPGLYTGVVNADSAATVNTNAFSTADAVTLIGGPRRVAQVGTDLIAVNPQPARLGAAK